MAKLTRRLTTTPTMRDEEIFLFLWKWKIATFKTLAHVFFGNASLPVAYHRLNKLRHAGFLRQRLDESGRNRVWTLDRKGFEALVNRLPELEEYGYGCENVEHDLLVNALHMGDWACGCPKGVQIFTEQQLRRLKPEMYPAWVPQTKNHRPDGYWHIANGNHSLTIAIEVELSAKSKDRYESVAKFYDHYDSIDRILWLVPTPQMAKKILATTSGTNFYRTNIHNFLNLEDFLNNHWHASIFLGPNKGATVSELLSQNLMQTLVQTSSKTPINSTSIKMSQHLLDTTSSPQNRYEKAKFNIRNFSD